MIQAVQQLQISLWPQRTSTQRHSIYYASQPLFIKGSIQIQQSKATVCIKCLRAFPPLVSFCSTFFFHTLSLVSKSYTKHSSARDKKEAAFSCKGSHLNANKHSFILITCDRRLQQNQRSMCIHWKTCTRQISIPVHNAKPSIILHQWKWRELAK